MSEFIDTALIGAGFISGGLAAVAAIVAVIVALPAIIFSCGLQSERQPPPAATERKAKP